MLNFALGNTAYFFLAGLMIVIGAVLLFTQKQGKQSAALAVDANRTAELERLIATAREESRRLESMIAAAERLRGSLRTHEAQPMGSAAQPTGTEQSPPRPINQASALGAAARSGTRPSLQTAAIRPSTERPFERIYSLAAGGMEPLAIAQEVRCPVGEVELILGLQRHNAT